MGIAGLEVALGELVSEWYMHVKAKDMTVDFINSVHLD